MFVKVRLGPSIELSEDEWKKATGKYKSLSAKHAE
jgi:hypothetical protein